ncbi:MAG: hypothetical protein WCG93_05195 [Paludibacter sp.]
MYLAFKQYHSLIAFLLLAVLLFVIVFTAYRWLSKKPFSKSNIIFAQVGMAVTHLQFLIGAILYYLSPLGMSNFSSAAMKNSTSRLYILEHPFMMIIGVVLVTIGFMKAKRVSNDNRKYKTIVIYYSLGLLIILSRIPWSTWS